MYCHICCAAVNKSCHSMSLIKKINSNSLNKFDMSECIMATFWIVLGILI